MHRGPGEGRLRFVAGRGGDLPARRQTARTGVELAVVVAGRGRRVAPAADERRQPRRPRRPHRGVGPGGRGRRSVAIELPRRPPSAAPRACCASPAAWRASSSPTSRRRSAGGSPPSSSRAGRRTGSDAPAAGRCARVHGRICPQLVLAATPAARDPASMPRRVVIVALPDGPAARRHRARRGPRLRRAHGRRHARVRGRGRRARRRADRDRARATRSPRPERSRTSAARSTRCIVAGGAGARHAAHDDVVARRARLAARRAASRRSAPARSCSRAAGPARRPPRDDPLGLVRRPRSAATRRSTVEPRPDLRRRRRRRTSAGVTAGMDLALALVEEDLGPRVALDVARVARDVRQAPRRPVAVQRPARRAGRRPRAAARAAGVDRRPPRRRPVGARARRARVHEPAQLRPRLPARDRA